ncbi:hypothetical protein [Pseudomonas gingeri]|uniref:hypothetical protein n=1 Tax=Pseudomonas gingeri TaxID=117681 RepID=UPI0015B802DA|nr:hypothetical protein [Pseudomonas gingeri]NWD50557.1 hypothetical protein [Pseudomonas gingeri]
MMRVLTKETAIGKYTQGSIFNCLQVSDGSERFGIIVTARCDIAHQRSRPLVCLPIYHLSDWMQQRGNNEVAEQSKAAINNLISDILKKYEVSNKAIEIYGLDKTLEILDQKKIKAPDKLKLEELEGFIKRKELATKNKIIKENRKKYLDTVIQNTRNDTFFLERIIHNDEPPTGYVVDLSEPICVTKKTLREISKGLEYVKYEREKDTDYKNITIKQNEQACFISTLISPYVELLLQRFSHLYNRVGTQDIAKKDLTTVRKLYEID